MPSHKTGVDRSTGHGHDRSLDLRADIPTDAPTNDAMAGEDAV